MIDQNKILRVEKIEDGYEIHYDQRVEFWDKELKHKLGESKIEVEE